MCACVCVCVCKRGRESERGREVEEGKERRREAAVITIVLSSPGEGDFFLKLLRVCAPTILKVVRIGAFGAFKVSPNLADSPSSAPHTGVLLLSLHLA